MESLSQQLRDLNLSDDFYVRSDLSNETNFLEKAKEKIEGQVTSSNCGFFSGKRIMCFSVELSVTPTKEIAKILLNTIEFLQSKNNFIRLVGVLVIQCIKDMIGLIWLSLPG